MKKIFDEVSEEFKGRGVSREQIVEAYYLFWANVQKYMQNLSFPTILVPKFGKFMPVISKVLSKTPFYEGDEQERIHNALTRMQKERLRRKRRKTIYKQRKFRSNGQN